MHMALETLKGSRKTKRHAKTCLGETVIFLLTFCLRFITLWNVIHSLHCFVTSVSQMDFLSQLDVKSLSEDKLTDWEGRKTWDTLMLSKPTIKDIGSIDA